ncbi:exonuclease SbcCD subunit D [Candidatus Dependentiae bacterium]
MIKFFHTADLHFGVEKYGKIDSKTGMNSRLLDFKKNFEYCIELAIKEKIDFFLFCGDAYKTAFPTPTQQKTLMQLLFKLRQANIPIVAVVGNHDHPLSFGKANSLDILSELPIDGFHVFSKPNILKLKTKKGMVQIVGIPWPTRNNLIATKEHHFKDSKQITSFLSQAVSNIISSFAKKLDPKIPSILAAHLTIGTGIFSGSEKCAVFGNDPIFLSSQLAINPFDYVALGHLHRYQNLNSKGYPAIVYSGSIERVDFGERKEKKGFCLVHIDEKKEGERCKFEFIKLNARPMIQIEVILKSGEDQTLQILKEINKHDIKDSILKIVYYVPEGKKDKVDLQQVQYVCRFAKNLAEIVPIRKLVKREKRASLTVDMNLETLLEKYFDTKDFSKEKKSSLLKKAREIYSDFSNKNGD